MLSNFGFRSNIIRLVKSNFSLYRLFIILVVFFYQLNSKPKSYFIETKNAVWNILINDIAILLLIPLLVSLISLIITYIRDINENNKLDEGYYRDIIKQLTPVELSYIDDYNIELKKDIMATLLELQLKKKIQFVDGKIVALDKTEDNLTLHEKYVLKKLTTRTFLPEKEVFINEFKDAILEDLCNSKILNTDNNEKLKDYERKYLNFKKKCMIIFPILMIIFASGLEVLMLYVSFFMLLILVFLAIKKLVDKNTNGAVIMFVLLAIYGAPFLMLLTLIVPVTLGTFQEVAIGIFEYVFLFIAIAFILIEFNIIINSNKLNENGKKLKSQLLGLKMFLNDYSNMKDKELNELNLWDEYLVYSVILNENKKVKNEVTEIVNKYFSEIL